MQLDNSKLCAHLLCTGTVWADKARTDAQAALQIQYGLENDGQGQHGLEVVRKQMKAIYALPDYDPEDLPDCSADDSDYSSDCSAGASYYSSD